MFPNAEWFQPYLETKTVIGVRDVNPGNTPGLTVDFGDGGRNTKFSDTQGDTWSRRQESSSIYLLSTRTSTVTTSRLSDPPTPSREFTGKWWIDILKVCYESVDERQNGRLSIPRRLWSSLSYFILCTSNYSRQTERLPFQRCPY